MKSSLSFLSFPSKTIEADLLGVSTSLCTGLVLSRKIPAPEVTMTRSGTRMDNITSRLAFLLSRCVIARADSELK